LLFDADARDSAVALRSIAVATRKYGVHRLVCYEMLPTMDAAILCEKRLEEWRRLWKIRLIENVNPEWIDVFDERTGEILDGPADLSRHNR